MIERAYYIVTWYTSKRHRYNDTLPKSSYPHYGKKVTGIITMAQGKERDMTQRNHGTKKIGWHYET